MKDDGIVLSEKYGLNPTMPICFWCGKEKGEIALVGKVTDVDGREIEMPMHACIDFEPCDACKADMAQGFTLMEATSSPNPATSKPIQKGIYPTGCWSVITQEAADRIFTGCDTSRGKAFVEPEIYDALFRRE